MNVKAGKCSRIRRFIGRVYCFVSFEGFLYALSYSASGNRRKLPAQDYEPTLLYGNQTTVIVCMDRLICKQAHKLLDIVSVHNVLAGVSSLTIARLFGTECTGVIGASFSYRIKYPAPLWSDDIAHIYQSLGIHPFLST